MLFIIIFVLSIISGFTYSMDFGFNFTYDMDNKANPKKRKRDCIVDKRYCITDTDGKLKEVNNIADIPRWFLEEQLIAAIKNPDILPRKQRLFIIRELLKLGVNPNLIISSSHYSFFDLCVTSYSCPLHYAVIQNDPELINLLLNSNANINRSNGKGMTPLMIAVNNKNFDAVKVLLERQANTELADEFDMTVLFHALTYNRNLKTLRSYIKIISILLKHLNVRQINEKKFITVDWVPLALYIQNLEDIYFDINSPYTERSERLEGLEVLSTVESVVESFIKFGADIFIGNILYRAGCYDRMRAQNGDVVNYTPLTDRIMKWNLHQIKKIFSRWPNLLLLIISYLELKS